MSDKTSNSISRPGRCANRLAVRMTWFLPLGSSELAAMGALHIWSRQLVFHSHMHLLVPGGGLTADGLRCLRVKDAAFLVPQGKLAARFKGRLKAWLQAEQPEFGKAVPAKVWWVKWVADIQPVGSGEAALKYLANHLCRPPLLETQLERWDTRGVTFCYRENRGEVKRVTVSVGEFEGGSYPTTMAWAAAVLASSQ